MTSYANVAAAAIEAAEIENNNEPTAPTVARLRLILNTIFEFFFEGFAARNPQQTADTLLAILYNQFVSNALGRDLRLSRFTNETKARISA